MRPPLEPTDNQPSRFPVRERWFFILSPAGDQPMMTGRYLFTCRFLTAALLPTFKGSTLRGAFGHALKKVCCTMKRRSCTDCLLAGTCVYSFIFEAGKARRPHPYVLEPPEESRREYGRGDEFVFNIVLFGQANDYLPHVIYAVELMGESGLGSRGDPGPGRFSLAKVTLNGHRIYEGREKILARDPAPALLDLTPPPSRTITTLAVRLQTPLRLKHQNHLQDQLPFHLLVRAALRRISFLEEAYGQGEPNLDYRGLVERAGRVSINHGDCQWVDLTRYSSRQQTAMRIGGLAGTIQYEGELTEFQPLLKYCEHTHLGKQTSFGLGRIEVTNLSLSAG